MDEKAYKGMMKAVNTVRDYLNKFRKHENIDKRIKIVESEISACFFCPHVKYKYNMETFKSYGYNCGLTGKKIANDATSLHYILPNWCPLPDKP